MKRLAFIFLLMIPLFATAQNRVIHGVVTAFDTYHLHNAKVTAKKGKAIVATDSTGRFTIVCNEKDVLVVKADGFFQQSVNIKNRDSVVINMVFRGEKYANDVVSNGYMTSENLTHAINNLSGENQEFLTYSSIYELIVGRFPGVRVSGNSIIIRNAGNLYGNYDALLVVNGAVVSDISGIRPSDVKSIDILKDSSAAIYGVRGAGGVVVITLK